MDVDPAHATAYIINPLTGRKAQLREPVPARTRRPKSASPGCSTSTATATEASSKSQVNGLKPGLGPRQARPPNLSPDGNHAATDERRTRSNKGDRNEADTQARRRDRRRHLRRCRGARASGAFGLGRRFGVVDNVVGELHRQLDQEPRRQPVRAAQRSSAGRPTRRTLASHLDGRAAPTRFRSFEGRQPRTRDARRHPNDAGERRPAAYAMPVADQGQAALVRHLGHRLRDARLVREP